MTIAGTCVLEATLTQLTSGPWNDVC